MSPFGSPQKDKRDSSYAQISLLAAVPAILVAAPLVGFFVGRWADGRFGTEPYLMITGVVFGFAAAAREIYNLVKKSEALEKRDRDDS